MDVKGARRAAVGWVDEVAVGLPGFRGAFFHGAINGMAAGDPFPVTSDVDVGVVFAESQALPRLDKIRRGEVIVEGSAIPLQRLATAEPLQGDHKLAHGFRTDTIIANPTGHLRRVQLMQPPWALVFPV